MKPLTGKKFTYSRGDVVMIVLPKGSGSVQSGFRPAVIIQNNKGNLFAPTVIVSPITTGDKPLSMPTHVALQRFNFLDVRSIVLTEQIMTISKSCITKKLGHLDKWAVWDIDEAIRVSLAV